MASSGPVNSISSVVLAGGQSSRLGMDKAFLEVKGQFLIERVIDRVRQLSDEVIIVGNEVDKYAELEAVVMRDVCPGKGALGGIYSGVKRASNGRSLVVACDMPFLNLSLLRYMQAQAASYDVVIPRIGQQTEALHAIYSKGCLPFIDRQLRKEDLRIIHFFPQVRVRYVEPEEIEVFDPQYLSFFNVNTATDLEKARRMWRREN